MEISFTPSEDVLIILNALLDKFENRAKRSPVAGESAGTSQATRSIKVSLADLPLPAYFSQTDPEPRTVANRQLQTLEKCGYLNLAWLPGESGHLLQAIILKAEPALLHSTVLSGDAVSKGQRDIARSDPYAALYRLLQRIPISDQRARLESLLLAEKFRYQKDDWRARALDQTLQQLRVGKSPAPFSLTDSNLNLDLLAILQALSTLTTETPYRVFSVRVLNDSKRFEYLKPLLTRLARRANPEWRSLTSEDLLGELNLVANPGYVHLSGYWELIDISGQIIDLNPFTPAVGFPASQITSLQKISIRAGSVLCIENLTSFYEFLRSHEIHSTHPATLCLMGNPSPSIRRLLRLIPGETPINLWSDMDFGGFNILLQLRKQVSPRIRPYLMDIATFDKYAHLSRPLTQSDIHNLKRLTLHPALSDVHSTIEFLLARGLKLEQEAIQV